MTMMTEREGLERLDSIPFASTLFLFSLPFPGRELKLGGEGGIQNTGTIYMRRYIDFLPISYNSSFLSKTLYEKPVLELMSPAQNLLQCRGY